MDLNNDDNLRHAIEQVLANPRPKPWVERVARFLEKVRAADLETRASREFHQMIWEENPVSDVGMGTVNITGAINDAGFRRWVAEESLKPLPSGREAEEAHIRAFFDQLETRLAQFSDRRPLVKMLRVMAGFFPRHFTTITANNRAIECHRALMGRTSRLGPVKYQLNITQRIGAVMGDVADEPKALAERMTIPWRLFESFVQKDDEVNNIEEEVEPGKIQLKPLPAIQRRKGLTSIGGGMDAIISAISFAEQGVSRGELMEHLRAEFPEYRESSLNTLFSALKNEFFVLHQDEKKLLSPTPRGAALLETNDPEELIPVLITRILGFDNALWFLKQKKSATSQELTTLLQSVNPGWTTNFAPSSLMKWLRDFGLVALQEQSRFVLTERGRFWADQIHWEPQSLHTQEEPVVPMVNEGKTFDIGSVNFHKLSEAVKEGSAFSHSLIHQLHCGLWSHRRRHFAIMAGLSGSGKTLLAKRYAKALIEQFGAKPETHLFIQAVQPGWYDPTPLFGYVNPLNAANYRRPPMLDLLLRAMQYPEQPFVIILDEMNLSHPEQYFAPVLSAMESGDALRLHNEGPSFDGVPNVIPYPDNVAFIGTVNMDETTHGISDKVLDRAFTLEFWDIDLKNYPHWHSRGMDTEAINAIRACLQDLLEALAPVRLHFGWRTVDDVLDYMALAQKSAVAFDAITTLDEVIYARVLPKLRGTETTRLRTALEKLQEALKRHGLTKSRDKVDQLKQDLTETGLMRFWR